jgi:hypothetical protein
MYSKTTQGRPSCRSYVFKAVILATYFIPALHAQSVEIPITPASFEINSAHAGSPEKAAQFGDFLGRRAVFLPSGFLNVREASFRDGTIEFDMASKPASFFLGVGFRVESEANMEVIYLRPGASDTLEAVQYTPRLNGDAIWQLLNSTHEKASAHIPKNEWFHIKIVVQGRSCKLFMNGSKDPTLEVTNLRREPTKGGIALWALGGGGYFSNMSYLRDSDQKPVPNLPRYRRAGLLSDWELSPAYDTSEVDVDKYPTLVSQWEKVYAEDPGFVLVNRYRTSPAMFPMPSRDEMLKGRVKGAKVVFARTDIRSAKTRERILKIGYSDDIVVYLNGKQIFSGKNALSYRNNAALGTFGLSDEAPVHLNPGVNELLVAVTEYNGGWAFECELSPVP